MTRTVGRRIPLPLGHGIGHSDRGSSTTSAWNRPREALGRREFTDVVTEYEPGRRVGHRSVSGAMEIYTACTAEQAGQGCRATVVYDPVRLPGGLLGRLTAPLTSRIVRRNFRADLARLKDIFEEKADAAR